MENQARLKAALDALIDRGLGVELMPDILAAFGALYGASLKDDDESRAAITINAIWRYLTDVVAGYQAAADAENARLAAVERVRSKFDAGDLIPVDPKAGPK